MISLDFGLSLARVGENRSARCRNARIPLPAYDEQDNVKAGGLGRVIR